MKVVHSFANEHNVVWKELMYAQLLSSLLAKEHYGNIEFHTTKEIANVIDKLAFPYNNIVTKNVSSKDYTWSMPKLRAYQNLKESFLHIDNDTFLFSKINFDKYKQKILFSHPDTSVKKHNKTRVKKDVSVAISQLIQTTDVDVNLRNTYFSRLNETYLRLYFKIYNSGFPDNRITNYFDIASIPNMNVTYVNDTDLFTKATNIAVEHYTKNIELIDGEKYGPCYIEQLVIHQVLRSLDKDYRKASFKHKHLIFKDVPTLLIGEQNYTPNIDHVEWPLVFKTRSLLDDKYDCCGFSPYKNFKKKIKINSMEEYKDYLEEDFGGFMHATYMKWYDWMQAYIIHNIRTRVGDQPLIDMHKYFRKIYPKYKLPLKSGGEKLYEKLTNFSFK